MTMRDLSASYWFKAGDRVEVVEDVLKAGISLRGRVGTVVETWEKCKIDPACCCSEQVDTGMAVRVQFADPLENNDEGPFLHYFAEDELAKAKPSTTDEPQVAFDGMSCVAFKLDQLSSDKPRGIASYDPSQPSADQ